MSNKPKRAQIIKPRHRDILSPVQFQENMVEYHRLGKLACYTGNAAHKKNPGDFNLPPPLGPRTDKTLCDDVNIKKRAEATRLLKKAFECGLVSEANVSDTTGTCWPKHIWALTEDGYPVEGVYDGRGYHGYPIPDRNTPLFNEIEKRWNSASQK